MNTSITTDFMSEGATCSNACLDLFSNIKTDYSLKSYEETTIYPSIPVDKFTKLIDFSIEPSSAFLDLSNTEIEFCLKLCLEDGSDLPPINPAPILIEEKEQDKKNKKKLSYRTESRDKSKSTASWNQPLSPSTFDQLRGHPTTPPSAPSSFYSSFSSSPSSSSSSSSGPSSQSIYPRSPEPRLFSRLGKRKRQEDDYKGEKAETKEQQRKKRAKRKYRDEDEEEDKFPSKLRRGGGERANEKRPDLCHPRHSRHRFNDSRVENREEEEDKMRRKRKRKMGFNDRVEPSFSPPKKSTHIGDIPSHRLPFSNAPPPTPNPDPPETFPGVNCENLAAMVIFDSVDIRLNNSSLSSVNGNYGITSYLMTILNYQEDACRSKLEMAGYEEEEDARTFDCRRPSAYRTRALLFKDSKYVRFRAPVMTSFHFSQRYLIPMVNVSYSFHLTDAKKFLKSSDQTREFSYQLSDVRLLIKRAHVVESLALAIEKRLASANALYHFENLKCNFFLIPSGLSTYAIDDVFSGLTYLPHEAFIFLIDQKSALGRLSNELI